MLTSAPETASRTTAGLKALLTSSAFALLDNVGWIRVTGEDRVRWLNGMATNNIAALQPGEGCYNFFLNAQGRIQGDCTAWMLENSILLQTAADRIPTLMAMLDHFIIMDDVELTHLDQYQGLTVAGPKAAELIELSGVNASAFDELRGVHNQADPPYQFLHSHSPLVPQYEFWCTPDHIGKIEKIYAFLKSNIPEVTAEDLEHLRILSGTPRYGVDIRNSDAAKDLPQETSQTRALHFSKGCYLGQEIVERIRSRGSVHRTFSGFLLTGDLPEPGVPLHDPSKPERPVGELTSVARIQLPSGDTKQFALGYIRREALDTHAAITYPGGTATPSALPFQLS